MNFRNVGIAALALLATGCKTGEPARSYCEAVCDWAVACAEAERSIDAEAVRSQCLADTEAIDASCASASAGELNPVEAEALGACVDAIDSAASAGECDGFTGSIDDLKTGTTVPECASQGENAQDVYNTAQSSSSESNEELCTRLSESFCGKASDCILGDYNDDIPQDVTDAAGGTPYDLCVVAVDSITTACVSNDLYSPEESLDDVNTARQAARECLAAFESVTCDEVFSGEVPALCAAAFTSTEDAANLAAALADLAAAFAIE